MFKRILSSILGLALAASYVIPSAAASLHEASSASNSYVTASENIEKSCSYDGELGAIYSASSTTFKVWAPLATSVKLNLYATGSDSEPGARTLGTYTMEKLYNGSSFTGVWNTTISGDQAGVYYTYTIATPDVKKQNAGVHETQDVYSYATGVNGKRSMVVDLDSTDPAGWNNDKHVLWSNSSDLFVWEAHVKDFSYNKNSGVSEKNRGKYLAFTETGTTLNGEGGLSTCVDYLKNLGITTVQLNPIADYASVDETGSDTQFNWGYDPMNYNVPEGSYSSNPYDGNVRITECKQMIQALHNAGISVVMDVVYNHTASSEESCFGYTVPKYYYRMNENGTYSSGSGCGNDTASERKMFRKFLIESCLYWVNEYHIDGFRFDLMALHDTETLNQLRTALDSVDPRITVWGEGWAAADSAYASQTCTGATVYPARFWDHINLDTRIGFFNDGIRDAMKGNVGNPAEWGWIQGNSESNVYKLTSGMCGRKEDNVYLGTQVVSYTSCHDNRTLWDQLCMSQGLTDCYNKRDDKLVAQNKLAGALLNLSQGTTFILAGEEMGRSKGGNENSYNAPPEVNMIDWSLAGTNKDIVEYYRGMRQIRDHFSLFKESGVTGAGYNFLYTDNKLACLCTNNKSGEWDQLFFMANSNAFPVTYTLPSNYNQNWVIVANEKEAGTRDLGHVSNGTFTVDAYSAVVAVDTNSFNRCKDADTNGYLDVDYVDTSTGNTLFSYTMSGKTGDKYKAYAPKTYGSEYILDTFTPSDEGAYTKNSQRVSANYLYTKPGTVTVNYYLTGTVTKVRESDVYKGRVGDTIRLTSIPDVLNYRLNKTNLPKMEYKVIYGDIEVNFYYDKISNAVNLHFKHSGSLSWAPVLWIWGSKNGVDTGNYCTNKTWPGDVTSDTNGDGWFDKTFYADLNDDCYNLIVSADNTGYGAQTDDYRGYTQNELWIVIDDSKVWNKTKNLTIYKENPDTNPNAQLAGTTGDSIYEHDEAEVNLYNINSDDCVDAFVSGYVSSKSIAGIPVDVMLNKGNLPVGKYFIGFKLNGSESGLQPNGLTAANFTMPASDVTLETVLGDQEEYVIDLEHNTSVVVPTEISNIIRDQNYYNAATMKLDLNDDTLDDVSLDPTTGTLTLLNGADYLQDNCRMRVRSNDVTNKLGWITFKVMEDPFRLTFDPNGGSGAMDQALVKEGRSYTLPTCTFTAPENSRFDCWLINGTRYAPGDIVSVTSDLTITASWTNKRTVSFDPNGGSGTMEDLTVTTSEFTLPECGYTPPTGCVFDCWRIGIDDYAVGDTVTLGVDNTITARWERMVRHGENPAYCTSNGSIMYYSDSKGNLYKNDKAEPLEDIDGDGVITISDTVIPAKGHSYGEPSWAWDGTESAAAVFTCANDPSHIETVNAKITVSQTPATDTAPALTIYTATATFNGEEYSSAKIVNGDNEPISSDDTDSEPISSDDTDSEPISTDDTDSEPISSDDTDSEPISSDDTDSDPNPSDDDSDEEGTVGELDGDGNITSADALEILRMSVGLVTPDDIKKQLADVDGDGEIYAGDALEVLRYSVGLPANERVSTKIKLRR